MAKQVKIRGVTYPSQIAAAKALGVTHQAINAARKEGRLDTVGLRKDGTPRRPYKRRKPSAITPPEVVDTPEYNYGGPAVAVIIIVAGLSTLCGFILASMFMVWLLTGGG